MPSHQLYALAFPEDALDQSNPSARRRQSQQGVISTGPPQVETIASEPGERRLSGHFRGNYSDVMAGEVEELLNADDIEAVPYYIPNASRSFEGYYEPGEQREGDRRDPRVDGVHRFSGVMSRKGTRRSHIREVSIANETVTNPFGSATTQTLYLSNTSDRPRWVSEKGDIIENASVQATFAAEKESFDEFDALEPTFSGNQTYSLVYDIAFDDEWKTDPRVWDDHDRAKNITTNGISVDPTWQHVYDSTHEYNGTRRIETGRMRLIPNTTDNDFIAQQWNDTSGQYESVTLGTSDWELLDWDIREIGLERVVSKTTWRNSTVPTNTSELQAEVLRGQNETLFYEPSDATSSTPSELVTLLDPIAMDTDEELGEQASLHERTTLPDE